MDIILAALREMLTPGHLFYLSIGVVLGLSIGILPGLGGIAGLSLVLPFIFGMKASMALAMMVGLVAVTTTSDTFASVLIGVPGTSGSQATVVDGFPMATRGEATRALSAAFTASLFGGIFGALVLTGAVFAARPIILMIGFGEQLMLILLALSMVGMLTGETAIKGLTACGLGLILGVVGEAPATAELRMTFDTIYLSDGIPLVVVGLGIFAIPEIVEVLSKRTTISKVSTLGKGWLQGLKDVITHRWIVLRCAVIGCLVGALPGLGGTVVDWISYGHVIQTSKDRENFGKGDIRGVLAPESSNNAKEGGGLIPTLLFGIPGSGSMALLLGGLVLIGVDPGSNMVGRDLNLTFVIIWSLAFANILGTGICFFLAKPVARLTTIRFTLVAPFMLALIFFAAFQATRDWGDLLAVFIIGVLGVYMKRFGWSRPALLIGYVLSLRLEASFYQTIQVYGLSFLKRPVVIVLLVLTVISIVVAARMKPHRPDLSERGPHVSSDRWPQIIFWMVLTALSIWTVVDGFGCRFLGEVFPVAVGSLTTVLLLIVGYVLFFGKEAHVFFYDKERQHSEEELSGRSEPYYLFLLVLMLAAAAVVGFLLGVAGFVFLFLRKKAGVSYFWCTVGALSTIAFLALLSHLLVLFYPAGILQHFVAMPWPFD